MVLISHQSREWSNAHMEQYTHARFSMKFQFRCHPHTLKMFTNDGRLIDAVIRTLLKYTERPNNHDFRCQAPQVMIAWSHLQSFSHVRCGGSSTASHKRKDELKHAYSNYRSILCYQCSPYTKPFVLLCYTVPCYANCDASGSFANHA